MLQTIQTGLLPSIQLSDVICLQTYITMCFNTSHILLCFSRNDDVWLNDKHQ